MAVLVSLIGGFVCILGILGLVQPRALVQVVRRLWQTRYPLYTAAGVRFAVGIIFILAAPYSHLPVTLRVIGILSLVGGCIILALGFERVDRLAQWWLSGSNTLIRTWAVVMCALGAFLIDAMS